jgi:hypothetical protein
MFLCFAHRVWCFSSRRTSALTCLRCRFAQRHIPPSGVMRVLPSWVNEYSTAMAFDLVTRLVINPVDSRLRRVLVSICWETIPIWRRNCPCRYGLSFSKNKTLGVHLPMKIGGTIFDSCILFIMSCLLRELLAETSFRIGPSHSSLAVGTVLPCQCLCAKRN